MPSISIILSAIAYYLTSSVFLLGSVRRRRSRGAWWKGVVVPTLRLRQWRTTLLCFVSCVLVSRLLAYVLLRASYRVDGFSALQADWAIPERELRAGGSGAGGQVWPLMVAAVLLPLAAWVLPPRRLHAGIALLLAIGLIASAVVVFLHQTAPIPS